MTTIISSSRVPLSELSTFHKNPRRSELNVIAESLQAHGQYRSIVVNKGTLTGRKNEILAGNHTFLAARSLNWPEIDVDWVDVDEETANKIVLVDNRSADLGSYDNVNLHELLKSLDTLDATGYSDDDLIALLGEVFQEPEYAVDVDDVPEAPEKPVSELGDVWLLGQHRVVCGSSTEPDTLAALFRDGSRADTIWTDPPYGVDYVGKTKDALTIQNDSKTGLGPLLTDSFGSALPFVKPGAPIYVAHADTERVTFETAIEECGYLIRQNLVWVKNTIVMGRSDYHYKHEPILYGFAPNGSGRLGRGGPNWHGDNKQSTVFNVDKPARNGEHPTMKPVELVRQMLSNSTPVTGVVLDLFGGSGSTLVAADSLGMKARICELDPRYVDVIVKRWENLTGKTAMREELQEAA